MPDVSVLEVAADLARRRWEFRTADKLTRAHLEHVKNGCPLAGVVAQCGIEQYASNYLAEWTPLPGVSDASATDEYAELRANAAQAVQQALVDNIGEQLAQVLDVYGTLLRGMARRASGLRRQNHLLLWLHALAVWRLDQLTDKTSRHHQQQHAEAVELSAHEVAGDISKANERMRTEPKYANKYPVWQKGDPEPANVRQVRDLHGDVWTRNHGGAWESPETMPCTWEYIAKKWAPLTEVIENDASRISIPATTPDDGA